jgi:ATP-dependent helicase/nuclease subunit B
MRAALGLEQPERRIGLAAHDFAGLAAQPNVLITRSQKADGAPTIPSRWLQRLEQLTRGLDIAAPVATDYVRLAARMGDVAQQPRIARPAPRPPVDARPRRLSVTEIETWLRDPYAIYAKHVLRLLPLDALDEPVGPLERGNALHKVLELFVARHPHAMPDNAVEVLAAIADEVFAEQGIPKAALAIWRPRFLGAAQAIIPFEAARRAVIKAAHLEIAGVLEIGGPQGVFRLSGRADRIDELAGGGAAILDYKSGRVPTKKQVERLLSPQLPLEAAMLARGAFAQTGALDAVEMIYLSLADEKHARKPVRFDDVAALAEDAWQRLAGRIARFDEADTAYPARVIPYRIDIEGDYDHLARVREWSASGWPESGNGEDE